MGSKRQYCKYIVPIIQQYINNNNIKIFIDCFCGGANLADKIQCDTIICNDLSPTLIALHKQAQKDFSLIPEDGNKEYWNKAYIDWKKIRTAINTHQQISSLNLNLSLYEIGAIEWYSSYSRGGFPKGYAKSTETRNYYKEAYRNHKKQAESLIYKKINFIQGDYVDIVKLIQQNDTKSILLYCDSPYKNTTAYGIAPNFNFEKYYNWLIEISKKYPIFVSEQLLPEYFNQYIIWQKDNVNRTIGLTNHSKACEKLYLLK